VRLRHFVALSLIASSVALADPARADDAQSFVQREHAKIDPLLRQQPSATRDAGINRALDTFVDFDELTRRAFGEPCHSTRPNCADFWSQYSDAQKAELRDLFRQVVQKNYRKNLLKTVDYDVDYRGMRDLGNGTQVETEAKNRQKPRDPSARVDYIVTQTQNGFRVVDIVTEGSSLAKTYYDMFRKKMEDPDKGYRSIVQSLKDKIAKSD
jgi:phospholipid transport system substrate-binding protein